MQDVWSDPASDWLHRTYSELPLNVQFDDRFKRETRVHVSVLSILLCVYYYMCITVKALKQ